MVWISAARNPATISRVLSSLVSVFGSFRTVVEGSIEIMRVNSPLKDSNGLYGSPACAGRARIFSQFRTKLFLLVLLLVVPAFGLVLHSSFQQRRIEKERARESAV